MMIYFRLLMMAVKSCGIIRFKNMRVSSLTRLAGRLSNRYTEEEIERVLEILDENDMIENDYRILSTAQETQMPLMNKAG